MRHRVRGVMMIAAILACLVNGVAIAQDKPADQMETLREKARTDKKVVVAAALALTEGEAKAFWPVYNAYQSDMITHYDKLASLVDQFSKAYDSSLPVDPHVRPRIQIGRGVSARTICSRWLRWRSGGGRWLAALVDVDALLTPTALTAAIPIDQADQGGTAAHFTRPVNYLGMCGLTVPDGFTEGGLPLSLQIVCHAGAEAMALRIGWAYEQGTDWHERRPAEPK